MISRSKNSASLRLVTERLGPLPIINRFLARLDLDSLLDRFVPTDDRRVRLRYSKALGVLLRSILVEREPIYRQEETVHIRHSAFGITEEERERISDDRIGRSLDRLFDADRGTLLTEVVIKAGEEFGLKFEEFHNDTTDNPLLWALSRGEGTVYQGKPGPMDNPGVFEGSQAGPETTFVSSHDLLGWRGPRPVSVRLPECERFDDTHRDMGGAMFHRRGGGLSLCGRFQTLHPREHGLHR